MASPRFTQWREDLLRTGAITPLRLGASQEDVVAVFGPPDDVSTEEKKGRPLIFKYADIEFHFDHLRGHCLSLVYAGDEDGEPRINIS